MTFPAGSKRIVAASVPVDTGIPGETGMAEPIPVSSTYDAIPIPTQRPAARARACSSRAAL